MQNAIEVENLKKSYDNFSLNNVSFTVPDNCITGFLGANGAGKSTTIKSILRLIRTDSGSIRFWGMEFDKHEQEIKDRIGVVLDDGSFYDHLTMAQMKNILAPAYSTWDENAFKANMEFFSLNPKQKISTLSKGMRAKYALALALSHNADLLIMDEPTSGLDPLVRREFMDIILDFMKKDGKSVLFSTHIVSDLERAADMLLLIHKGNIVFQAEKDALLLQPLTYKFGIEKTRYINMVVMVGIGVGFPYFVKAVVGGNINLDFLTSLSPVIISCLTFLLSLIILVVSAIISISVYKKKEF